MTGRREIEFSGTATLVEGCVVTDEEWVRIERLLASHLEAIAVDPGGDALYVDPSDGKLWELSAEHLPPVSRKLKLRSLDALSAHEKYGGGVAWGDCPVPPSNHGPAQLSAM